MILPTPCAGITDATLYPALHLQLAG
jgi:hypothetical protein